MEHPRDAFDVDDDGQVSPIDALLVINRLNQGGTRLPSSKPADEPYYDVSPDGVLSPIDALVVINRLNRGAGEGETVDQVMGELLNEDQGLHLAVAIDEIWKTRKSTSNL